ncbi:ParA family protein [Methanosarcina mazei]|uniref:ParA family protein n=1 Tax=Methanosarcina mazei TaxID=2209 RepID=A0A6C0VG34_METMZ|nr:ParA family protein [Methanosarcina mazei]QIB90125.1 ParA family protein [Methanosarcina mazei]
MNKIISVTNSKGGCGKTMTAVNVAAGLALLKKKVLFIDMDPARDASRTLLPDDTNVIETTRSIFVGIPIIKCIYQSTIHGLDIVPANKFLENVEQSCSTRTDRYSILKKAVHSKDVSDYDYIIIDTPPSLGFLIYNALVAADKLIIPIHGVFGIKGFAAFASEIAEFASNPDGSLKIDSVVMTMEENTKLCKEIRATAEQALGDKVCKIGIPKSVKYDEASGNKTSIYGYAPGSSASIQHMKLVDELLEKWETM